MFVMKNRRAIIHDRTTLRGPSNPLHIGDPYGDPSDITQGQMISNTQDPHHPNRPPRGYPGVGSQGVGMCRKKKNRRTIYPKGPFNPLHIGDP